MANILKRLSQGLRIATAVALLTVGTYAVAVEFRGDHPDTYVVKRGDTLWDIAGKFLQRPWLWPEIWQANPQIKNPHLIYPGDVISLAYLDRVAVQAGPRTDAPVNAVSLSEIEPYLRDLRIVDSFKQLPYIVGLEEDRTRAVNGHLVYALGLSGAQVGQRYTIVRPTTHYRRMTQATCCNMPSKNDLDFRGEGVIGFGNRWSEAASADSGDDLGYELMRVNAGILTKLPEGEVEASTLRLDDASVEVRVGDRLIPVDAQPYDLQFFPHAPKQAMDYDKARVLTVANSLTSGGPRDVIAISAGSADGIDNGTVLSVWRQGSNAVDRVKYKTHRSEQTISRANKVRLPDEYAGHAIVFRTFNKVSYALVMRSGKPTRVGYHLMHPDTK